MGKKEVKDDDNKNKVPNVQEDDPSGDPDKKKKAKEVQGKVTEIAEGAEAEGADPQKIQNIIGEIKPPDDLNNQAEVKAFYSEIAQGMRELLARTAPPAPEPIKDEPAPEPPPKKRDHFGYEIEHPWLE